ncbi:MAG: antirestriction protein ArdA [Henriciella sp.]
MSQSPTPAPLAETPDQEMAAPDMPRIYVACLASYNNGRLHGAWVDAGQGEDQIWKGVHEMLVASPDPHAEEWAIHDYDGFDDAYISEYACLEHVCALAEFIFEHGTLGAKLYNHFGGDLSQASAAFNDYAGEYTSVAEFAEQLTGDAGPEVPDSLQYYIDWQAMGRDLELGGDVFTIETRFDQLHVFWSR